MSFINFGNDNSQYQPQNQLGSIVAAQKAAATQASLIGGAPINPFQNPPDPDKLSKTFESSWSGISFPNTGAVDEISWDLVQHKYPGLDSARIENTGRNPGVFQITGVFSNHINPAAGETWKYGTLYPNRFNQLYNALLQNKEDIFVHPVLGKLICRVVNFKTAVDPKFRDGQVIQMTFIETLVQNQSILGAPNNIQSTASNLDSAININPQLVPSTMSVGNFFSSIVASIKAITSYPTTVVTSVLGQINAAVFQVNSLISFITSNFDSDPSNGPLAAPIKNQAFLLLAQLINTKNILFSQNATSNNKQTVGVYTTQAKTTLCALSTILGNSITQICTLNPNLLSTLTIPPNTVIKFFNQS